MTEVRFEGATAFLTGGAQGIGLGIARALAKRHTRLVLVDIDAKALEAARAELAPLTPIETFVLDVRDRVAFARVADEAEAALGPVSLLFNNAGVASHAPVGKMSFDDWDFMLGINLGGVVNGTQTFLPRMLQRGGGGYIVNTASGAGLVGAIAGYLYVTSKFAVVGMSESLNVELREAGIGVSVLCPAAVATKIMTNSAQQQRDDRLNPNIWEDHALAATERVLAEGTPPDAVGEMVCAAMARNQLYIHTDDVMAELVKGRTKMILDAMPSAEESMPLEIQISHPSVEQRTSLDGTYEITLHTPAGPEPMTLELATDGSAIRGNVKSKEGVQEILKATYSGNTVNFTVPITIPMPLSLNLTATVDGDIISGTAKVSSISLKFDGKRV